MAKKKTGTCKAYYQNQYNVTERNKSKRAEKLKRRMKKWKNKK